MNNLPKGFPTHSRDISGKTICLGDKVTYDFDDNTSWFVVVFENNAFRKKYPKWDKTLEKPILEYGPSAENMRLKVTVCNASNERIRHSILNTLNDLNMNTTTETNSPLTPIQALNRCLEWFTLHQPTAVLPGTKLNAIQELRNVILDEELRNETPRPENYTLTLEKIKACVELEGFTGDALRQLIDVWYKIEIKNGASEAEALETTLDKFAAKTFEMARNIKTENSQLREVLEIARRYALVEYGESAACRIIASEIQKVFPANGKETIHT